MPQRSTVNISTFYTITVTMIIKEKQKKQQQQKMQRNSLHFHQYTCKHMAKLSHYMNSQFYAERVVKSISFFGMIKVELMRNKTETTNQFIFKTTFFFSLRHNENITWLRLPVDTFKFDAPRQQRRCFLNRDHQNDIYKTCNCNFSKN